MAFILGMDKILEDLRPEESWSAKDSIFIYANLTWLDVTTKPTEQEMLDAELAAAKVAMVVQIKNEAQARILAVVPQWRQNNMGRDVYDEVTNPKLSDLNTLIDDIRTDSDTAEIDVNALSTVAAVVAFTW